jgi:cell division protein ZapA (FtsZ GTPase activity inhibitor)
METQHQPVEVEVCGQRFKLRSEKSAAEMRQIAAYVDYQLQQVMAQQHGVSPLRMALMAALTIADDYHTATGHLAVPPVEE